MAVRAGGALLAWAVLAPPVLAQSEPLSAIDWLSDSIEAPYPGEPPVAESALPEPVVVQPLGAEAPDALGLLSPDAAGLPAGLWEGAGMEAVGGALAEISVPAPRPLQGVLRDLLAVETPPPEGNGGEAMFYARIDALMALGRLDTARALLRGTEIETPAAFRRWFDIALLTGRENAACARLREFPEITPTYDVRVFCLARGGDWPAAYVTMELAGALEVTGPAATGRLRRFLDDFAETPSLPPPQQPTPLDMALLNAVGEPLSTARLPLAYAHADLRPITGWKMRIEAAERLARAGAIRPARLWEIYGEREPSASGHPWDRVAAVEAFRAALPGGDVAGTLPAAWDALGEAELRQVFAASFGPDLAELELSGRAAEIRRRAMLLSPARAQVAGDDFAARLARGELDGASGTGPVEQAIAAGLAAPAAPEGAPGLAILRAVAALDEGADGNLDALRAGLSGLAGLEMGARARAAALAILLEAQS